MSFLLVCLFLQIKHEIFRDDPLEAFSQKGLYSIFLTAETISLRFLMNITTGYSKVLVFFLVEGRVWTPLYERS